MIIKPSTQTVNASTALMSSGIGFWTALKPIIASSLVMFAAWQVLVVVTDVPEFILPSPLAVISAFQLHALALSKHTLVTAVEIIAGLLLGSVLGIISAILITINNSSRRWVLPLMVVSQSLPVFALAPILTLWLGYGMASKIAMATLIIYFPVVAATYDGLRHTPSAMLDLAQTLDASRLSMLLHIRLPAAFPSIASGIRVAASVAPIGAVVGEWVGSSQGLGYYMLQANGRMQTDAMFAALLCLCLLAVSLYFLVNTLLDRCLYWQPDSSAY